MGQFWMILICRQSSLLDMNGFSKSEKEGGTREKTFIFLLFHLDEKLT